MKKKTKKTPPSLQIKPGRYVIAVPIEWRVSMYETDPDMVCLHVARETFGKKAELVGLEDELYASAVAMLEKVCLDAGKEFDLVDPVEIQVKINGDYKYVRIADARKC